MMAQARETGNNNIIIITNATSLSNATATNAATSTALAISGTTIVTMVQGSQSPSN